MNIRTTSLKYIVLLVVVFLLHYIAHKISDELDMNESPKDPMGLSKSGLEAYSVNNSCSPKSICILSTDSAYPREGLGMDVVPFRPYIISLRNDFIMKQPAWGFIDGYK